jgi:oxaloacetate decarboxylase alpha subunit
MAEMSIVDTSLRDGNQSLWGATGLTTPMMLEVAPLMERVGFKALDFISSTHMAVAARYKQEDPWERIRLMRAAMPTTPLQFLSTGLRFISWETASPEFMALVFRTIARNGIDRFALADPMNDVDSMIACARMVKAGGGAFTICALTFTISPVHDDQHYASRAAILAAEPAIDAFYIKDPGGLLTTNRARTLIPAIQAALGGKPLELHSHCTIGLADLIYLDAPEYGIRTVQCATGVLGQGTSNPESQRVVSNLRALGHHVAIDDAALAEVSAYFASLAAAEGLPAGTPQAHDAAYLRHQLPGGVVGTMKRHLAESRLTDRLPAVMEELGRVREELGWPIVMTPFSQMLLTQAVLNVTGKERYATIPDEIIRYALGRFGRPNIPINPEIMDRIEANPRTEELRHEADMAPLSELRRRLGANLSDEEFLLRATMPGGQVDQMIAAGPAKRHYQPVAAPVMDLVRQILARGDLAQLVVERPGFRLELHGGRAA